MKNDKYQSWHYFPLNLTSEEIADPFIVLEQFFNISWIGGQLKLLKKWRKYIIRDDFYRGANGHPNDLLFVHVEAVRIIEAAFLLRDISVDLINVIFDQNSVNQQIKAEHEAWGYHAKCLSLKEIADPTRVIKKLCRLYTLPDYRAQLHDWLVYGLSTDSCDEFLTAAEIIPIYDILQKLIEAFWLIHMRRTQPVIPHVNETHVSQDEKQLIYNNQTPTP